MNGATSWEVAGVDVCSASFVEDTTFSGTSFTTNSLSAGGLYMRNSHVIVTSDDSLTLHPTATETSDPSGTTTWPQSVDKASGNVAGWRRHRFGMSAL
jgi:hypothetical protein